MKLLKQKKLWLAGNLLIALIACNNHATNVIPNHSTSGTKNPVIITPAVKDTTKNQNKETGSPNEEYEQHKIDSIKQNKQKPKVRNGKKND